MRSSAILVCVLLASACEVGFDVQPDPPILRVMSPQRSLVRDAAGALVVTGMVAPNPTGAAVARVTVNDVPAALAGDGTFTATIEVPAGATLIHTVATDAAGGLATDTRSVLAGERRMAGSSIPNAIGAAVSANAFTNIAAIATRLIKAANLTALIAPLNPIVHAGDEAGPDCLYAQAFVETVTITDAKITLVPVAGGLQVSAMLAQPHITGRTQHAVACANGTSTFDIRAASATLSGVLRLSTAGMAGFTTEIASPVVQLPGLQIQSSAIPDAILNMLPLEKVIEAIAPAAVKLFVNPLLNDAFGALTGPQRLAVLGKTVTLQVAPRTIAFDASGGEVMLDMRLAIDGTSSPGFTFTPNGTPALEPGTGIGLGIADDLANDVLAQLASTGLLNLTLRQEGSDFDLAQIAATSPPMISADGSDGRLRLILPDMLVTFLERGTPVARAAVNAEIPVAIKPAAGGSAVQVDLGTPAVAIDTLEDGSGLPIAASSEKGTVITLGAAGQKGTIAEMLKSIPLPKLGGVTLSDVSVTGANGYVLVTTQLQ